MDYIVLFAGLAVLALLIALNLWDKRRRAKLTPAERRADDKTSEQDMQLW